MGANAVKLTDDRVCDVCRELRLLGDHSKCSKERQAAHTSDRQRRRPNKLEGVELEEYVKQFDHDKYH